MFVGHVAIQVTDMEEAKTFYEDTLGLDHSRDFILDGVQNYYVSGSNGTEIQIKYDPKDQSEILTHEMNHIGICVENIDEIYKTIISETNVKTLTEPEQSEVALAKIAFIKDPFGYTLELYEYVDPQ